MKKPKRVPKSLAKAVKRTFDAAARTQADQAAGKALREIIPLPNFIPKSLGEEARNQLGDLFTGQMVRGLLEIFTGPIKPTCNLAGCQGYVITYTEAATVGNQIARCATCGACWVEPQESDHDHPSGP